MPRRSVTEPELSGVDDTAARCAKTRIGRDSAPVQAVLDAMAIGATPPSAREQRTLVALDQEAATNDPVGQAEATIRYLDELATRSSTSAERAAVDQAVRAARLQLRQARRE